MKKHLIILGIAVLLICVGLSGCVELFQNNNEINDEEVTIPSIEWFQTGNNHTMTYLQPKPSQELEDNRIGFHAHCFYTPEGQGVFPDGVLNASYVLELGVKRARLAINTMDAPDPDDLIGVTDHLPELSIDPEHDEFITTLADNGITITYVLSFWDMEGHSRGVEVGIPRFKTEDEIHRYLDFVQFIVYHFKDRIQYYEIWNEPTIKDTIQWIEVEDYINLVKRAVPVILQEYPDAKIVVGGTSSLFPYWGGGNDTESKDYLFSILRSDIMPLVDVVSWHPMYGSSPEYDWHRQYYYEYPSIVQEIKDVASTHGFTGEYVADEIHWCTPDLPSWGWPTHSETKSGKYLTRGIMMHRGMNITVTQLLLLDKPNLYKTSQNLCTVMAGAQPVSLSLEIESNATNIRNYSFSLPNGDMLVALWTDGVAVDGDPGVKANLTVQGITSEDVTGIDVLEGFQQPITMSNENGNLTIQNLIVRDYPMILHIVKSVLIRLI